MQRVRFPYTKPDIHGEQLADEVLRATGVDTAGLLVYVPGDQAVDLVLDSEQPLPVVAIQAVVDAHTPDPDYFADVRERRQLRAALLTRAQSAVGKRLDDLTAAERNALVALLLFKEGAISSDLHVQPLAEWVRS